MFGFNSNLDTSFPVDLRRPLSNNIENNGLISRWMVLNGWEGGKYYYDLSGTNSGTLINGPTWVRNGLDGYGAISFNGSSYISVADSPSLDIGGTSMAIALRVRFDTLDDLVSHKLVCRDSTSGGDRYFQFDVNKSGSSYFPRFLLFDNTDSLSVNVSHQTAVQTGMWYSIIANLVSGVARIWLNGVQSTASATLTGTCKVGTENILFGVCAGQGYLKGSLDDIILMKRGFSNTEIAAMYNNPKLWNSQTLNYISSNVYFSFVQPIPKFRRNLGNRVGSRGAF